MNTSELAGAALDWAVAKCEGHTINLLDVKGQRFMRLHKYSTDWAQGGPIIEREGFDIEWVGAERCRATYDWLDEPFYEGFGPTPLIAAMRCYVASQLGDNIDVPKELK